MKGDVIDTSAGLGSDLKARVIQLFEKLRAQSFDGVGITRETYGDGETQAMALLAAFAESEKLDVHYDEAANLVITLPGEQSDLPYVVCGSHLDSVPEGGNFDGAAGVIAGLAALVQFSRHGIRPKHTIKIYGLRGEESAWFGPCYLGSRALFGKMEKDDFGMPHRNTGKPLRDYMKSSGANVEKIMKGDPLIRQDEVACYFELHIEQGPVMVAREVPVGIVTGIRGNNRHPSVKCVGEAAHSGAVPRWLRHDAVFAVSELIMRLDRHWQALLEQGEDLVVTVGIIGTNPAEHAMSRVPGNATFSLEYRSQSAELLAEFEQLVRDEANIIERLRKVSFDLGPKIATPPAVIDSRLVDHLNAICDEIGVTSEELPSGAGHDAAVFANNRVPSAMIFVRNEHGSHNPHEAMNYDDYFRGVEVLRHALLTAPEVLG